MYKPLLDYKEEKSGIRYDFSILFLQKEHIKTILGVLLKENIKLQNLLLSESFEENHFNKKNHIIISELIKVISCYEEKKT